MPPQQAGSDGHIHITYKHNVAILQMDRGENRLNLDFCKKMHQALDAIERREEVKALITTGTGKFFHNGVDRAWLASPELDSDTLQEFRHQWAGLLTRVLTFPILTIAAINGHAFAAGAVFSMAHDYRVMRSDRGWFCVYEVHAGIPLSPIGSSILRTKLNPSQISDVVIVGKRMKGTEAKDAGIVMTITSSSELITAALNIVHSRIPKVGIKRESMAQMKKSMYENILIFYKPGSQSEEKPGAKSNL